MTEPDRHYQLLLEPDQYEALEEMASKQGSAISDIAREVIRLGLESLKKQRHMEALERLNQRRLEDYRTHGVYQGDLVAEVRAEREKQIDRVMRGEP